MSTGFLRSNLRGLGVLRIVFSMFSLTPVRLLVLLALFGGSFSLFGETPDAKSKLGKTATSVSEKRFQRQIWKGGDEKSPLGRKSFHMKEYDKHYSSLGSRKASSEIRKKMDHKAYTSPEVVSHKRLSKKMSRWSRRPLTLEERSRIETSQKSELLRDRQMYQAILQDTPQAYADLAKELSMKDINRFAFRRNRSKEAPGVTAAGQESARAQ